MRPTKTLKKFIYSLVWLSFLCNNLTQASFISDLFDEINALNDFNAMNRQLFYEFLSQAITPDSQPAPQDLDDQEDATAHAIESFTFENIAGEIPQDVLEIVHFIQHPEYFTRLGAKAPKGILMYGPPGTGKTSLARAIAGEAGATFFHACASEFMEMYVGVGPQRVRELFEKAKKEAKAIIFIDELDAIAGTRDQNDGNDERLRTLTELLNQMDGFDQSGNITVIAATNRIHGLDKAIIRPGRFDRLVEIPLPNQTSREAIIRLYCSKIVWGGPDNFFAELALKTVGFSGADLQNMVNEAAVFAARNRATSVQTENLMSAFYKIVQQKKRSQI